jgi:glycosyltransferase involved in cell wall biosynthesis
LLSIIVAVHNQLAMNRLFWRHLSANTENEWELIVIDNGSSDGSAEFFTGVGASSALASR